MLLEIKTRNRLPKKWQLDLFAILDRALIVGLPLTSSIEYRGLHIISFEKTCFSDGRVFLDHYIKTEDQIRTYLSME
jgi:hypothetical protein